MARLFFWLVEHVGREHTMDLIRRISQVDRPVHLITPNVEWDLVRQEFKRTVQALGETSEAVTNGDLDSILNEDTEETRVTFEKARSYARRLGADLTSASQGHTFVNGKHFNLDDVSIITANKSLVFSLVSDFRNSSVICKVKSDGRCNIYRNR